MQKIKEVKIKDLLCHELCIENDYIKFSCLDYGSTITGIYTREQAGFTNNVLCFKNYDDYYLNPYYLNSVIAPIPGRVENARLFIDNKEYLLEKNEHTNCLHSGFRSTAWKLFDYQVKDQEIILHTTISYFKANIDKNIDFQVVYRLDKTSLIVTYSAFSKEDILFDATNHCYFNLNAKDIETLFLKVNADVFLTTDAKNLPDKFKDVKKTPWDFTKLRSLKESLQDIEKGIDNCYILKDDAAIELYNPQNKKKLEIITDRESCVIYTADQLKADLDFQVKTTALRKGICFETQSIPNGMNNGLSNAWYLKKGKVYSSSTIYRFTYYD